MKQSETASLKTNTSLSLQLMPQEFCLLSHFHKLRLGADAEDTQIMGGCLAKTCVTLTVWSESGGRTICRSMVLRTIFHSSFRTRLRTVFSQILANRIRLERKKREMEGWSERQKCNWLPCLKKCNSAVFLLLVQQVHEGSEDSLCVHGCITLVPCISFHLHELLVHLFDTVLNHWLETVDGHVKQPS